MAELAVVVVAYRSADTLQACLAGILADPVATVVVVDNSGDPATARLCAAPELASRVSYVDPGANLGYARAANLGLSRRGDAHTVAVVNPDVRLTRTLTDLLRAARPGPREVVAGRLTSPAHPDAVNARPATTPGRELAKAIRGSRAYRLPGLATPDGDVRPVDQLDGALLVLGAAHWAELGGFDERFELYYEDVDLCARAEGSCRLVNTVWGEHIGGHSFRRSAGAAYAALRISRVRYARKWWHPRRLAVAAVLAITLAEYAARSLTLCPEGQSVRNRTLGMTLAELHRPGSQWVLRTPEHDEGAVNGR
jgi:GT2 family glycosyltransferase